MVNSNWTKYLIITIIIEIILGSFIIVVYFMNKNNIGIFKEYVPKPIGDLYFVNALPDPNQPIKFTSEDIIKRKNTVLNNAITTLNKAKNGGVGFNYDTLFGFDYKPNPIINICTTDNLMTEETITQDYPCGIGIPYVTKPNNAFNNPSYNI